MAGEAADPSEPLRCNARCPSFFPSCLTTTLYCEFLPNCFSDLPVLPLLAVRWQFMQATVVPKHRSTIATAPLDPSCRQYKRRESSL